MLKLTSQCLPKKHAHTHTRTNQTCSHWISCSHTDGTSERSHEDGGLLSFESPLLARHTHGNLSAFGTANEEPAIVESTIALRAAETLLVPLATEGFDDCFGNRPPTLFAPSGITLRIAADAPRMSVLLHELALGSERVTTLGAEEVARVPGAATRHDDFSLDGGFAALASRRKELMEVKMAVEADASAVAGERGLFDAGLFEAFGPVLFGLRVEADVLERCFAVVAAETFGVEAEGSSGYYTAFDRVPAEVAAGTGTSSCGGVDGGCGCSTGMRKRTATGANSRGWCIRCRD